MPTAGSCGPRHLSTHPPRAPLGDDSTHRSFRGERRAAEIPQPPLRDETAPSQPLGDGQAGPQDAWTWQTLPDGLIYHSYLAGPKEPRFASQWVHNPHEGWLWDIALGGRVGILRYGTRMPAIRRAGSWTWKARPFHGWTATNRSI